MAKRWVNGIVQREPRFPASRFRVLVFLSPGSVLLSPEAFAASLPPLLDGRLLLVVTKRRNQRHTWGFLLPHFIVLRVSLPEI